MRLALLCPPLDDHIEVFEALAEALALRGHAIVFLRDARDFEPQKLRSGCFDGLLVDQAAPSGVLLAERLGLPFIAIACGLPNDAQANLACRRHNQEWRAILATHLHRRVDALRRRLRRGRAKTSHAATSPLGTITQMVDALDFPGNRTQSLHAVGLMRRQRQVTLFRPRERRPLIFAAFETGSPRLPAIYAALSGACENLGLRFAVAHNGHLNEAQAAGLHAELVAERVDRQAMMRRTGVFISDAGLAATLEALEEGVPMLVLPVSGEQSQIAARLSYHRAGLELSPRWLTQEKVEEALIRLLAEPEHARAARRIGTAAKAGGGASHAAFLVERLLSGEPVAPFLSVARAPAFAG